MIKGEEKLVVNIFGIFSSFFFQRLKRSGDIILIFE